VSAASERPAAEGPRFATPRLGSLARSFAFKLGLVVAFGVVLRVLYTVLIAPWPPPVSDDQVYFHLMPSLLADGRGFIQPQLALAGHVRLTAAHPPFYSIVLAGPAELGITGQLAQRLTGSVFGAGTMIAIALIARRLAGERAALLAAGIASVYPILITADGALMSESLYGLLVALSLLVAYRLVDEPRIGRALLLGGLIGLAAVTRGEALLLLVLVLIPVVRRPGGARAAAVACLAMVVVLTPWTVRNWIVFDRFVPVSTDGGAVIGGANCQSTYYGSNIGGWNILCDRPFPARNEAVETARQLHDGLNYARRHLTRLPVVAAARLARGWSFLQPGQTNPGRSASVQNLGTGMYYVLLVLALYGLLLLRRRRRPTWLVMAPVLMVCFTMVLIYGFLRFRHPAEISLVVLAGVAVDRIWSRCARASGAAEGSSGRAPSVPVSP
jgi:4-amino-4-deoxy-L-arabinose transferase-like glycosyltransferase